jgi:hypothetical protein
LSRLTNAIDLDHLIVVVVGDRSTIEAPLKALGYEVVSAPSELVE